MNEASLSEIAREARELREYVASEQRQFDARERTRDRARRVKQCAGCKDHAPTSEMYQVPEDHMIFYAGDLLCYSCAGKCGAR